MLRERRSTVSSPPDADWLDLEDPESRFLLHLWVRGFAVTTAPLRELEAYVIYSIRVGLDPAWATSYPLDLDCVGTPLCLIHRQAWFTFCQRVRTAIRAVPARALRAAPAVLARWPNLADGRRRRAG